MPSANRFAVSPATFCASRVLPLPPAPIRVYQPSGAKELDELGNVVLAADKAVERDRHIGARRLAGAVIFSGRFHRLISGYSPDMTDNSGCEALPIAAARGCERGHYTAAALVCSRWRPPKAGPWC